MRAGSLLLVVAAAATLSPLGDAVRDEVRDVRATQYEKGRQVACNIRVLNALTAQDVAKLDAAERRCARYVADAPPSSTPQS